MSGSKVHRLKVTLRGVRPPVWRRIEVGSDFTLGSLAPVLEAATGWDGSHLHAFDAGGVRYQAHDEFLHDHRGVRSEDTARVCDVLPAVGAKMRWEYDFGDGWEHDVVVEAIEALRVGQVVPACVGGARACPPEDCGGAWGYAELLEARSDRNHPRHEDSSEWLPASFDPEAFDAGAANRAMQARMPRHRTPRSPHRTPGPDGRAGPATGPPSLADLAGLLETFGGLSADERSALINVENDPWELLTDGIDMSPALRFDAAEKAGATEGVGFFRDVGIVRDFVGQDRKLTQTLNLTPADVRALLARLATDGSINAAGQRRWIEPTGVIRSANDVPRLQFLIAWAKRAGALRIAHGRMSATASFGKLSAFEASKKAALVLLGHGCLTAAHEFQRWTAATLDNLLDEGVPHFLAVLWSLDRPFDYEELSDVVAEIGRSEFWWPESPSRDVMVRGHLDTLFDTLEYAGLVQRLDAYVEPTGHGSTRRRGGTLLMTDFGRASLAEYLDEHGFNVPVIGELTDGPITAIFEKVGEWHKDRVTAEFVEWAATRGSAAAIDEVLGVVNGPGDPLSRVAAVEFVAALGGSDAAAREANVRLLLDSRAAGHAVNWLMSNDVDVDVAMMPSLHASMLFAGTDLLALTLEEDPGEFVTTIETLDLADFVERSWRFPDEHVGDVLEAIGRLHPHPATAKAARKAALKHRSNRANQR